MYFPTQPGMRDAPMLSPAKATGIVDLTTLGGSLSLPSGINNSGLVAGWGWLPGDPSYDAFSYTSGSGIVDLGTLGGAWSFSAAVNAAGQIAGGAHTANGEMHAFLHQNGTMKDLNELAPG